MIIHNNVTLEILCNDEKMRPVKVRRTWQVKGFEHLLIMPHVVRDWSTPDGIKQDDDPRSGYLIHHVHTKSFILRFNTLAHAKAALEWAAEFGDLWAEPKDSRLLGIKKLEGVIH